ncbi:MAG: class I SAM-dependent methyltransferase [Planctomycetota bacterium]
MDKNRFSYVAHGHLPVWNPVGVSHLKAYLSQLVLTEKSTVLDIGCGRGQVLNLILTRHRATGIGVDSSPFAIGAAATDFADLVAAGRLRFFERTFDARDYDAASFDLVICIGSTHAAGGYLNTLRTAKRLLRPGGMLLVGEGYWKCSPCGEYLAFLKMSAEDQTTHQGNQSRGVSEDVELVSCSECSQEEWDAYEDQYARNVEEFVRANEHDPDVEAMLQRIRPWREAYLRWGRDTLGFGLYLFRVR